MPFNGSGSFSVYTPGTPYVTGTVISSSVANLVNSDFATGLSNAICKDGQTTPTANIGIGNFKIINLATGTVSTDAINLGQITGANSTITSMSALTAPTVAANPLRATDLQAQKVTAFTTGGTSAAFTLTPIPASTANAANQRFMAILNAAPTGSPTLAVSGLLALNFKYKDSTGTKQFVTSTQAPSGHLCDIMEDGTDWVLLNPLPTSASVALRSYLAGLTLSTAGTSTTISIAAGMATDDGNTTSMSIAAFTKTTASFVAGSGNGALDTGVSLGSASTWYHLWLISTAGGLTDILMSLSATAPTMPATYTLKRRIGSAKLDGSKNWTLFLQTGNEFMWDTPPASDISATNPGIVAITQTLTVPTGVKVQAILNAKVYNGTGSQTNAWLLSDLSQSDIAPSATASPLGSVISGNTTATATTAGAQVRVWTNTSAQIRSRLNISGAADATVAITIGWVDTRGRDL